MWDYECVRIPYWYNENKRWYVPDFMVTFLDGHKEMWEIKPKEYVATHKNNAKCAASFSWCRDNIITSYRVLTGDELQTMQVI